MSLKYVTIYTLGCYVFMTISTIASLVVVFLMTASTSRFLQNFSCLLCCFTCPSTIVVIITLAIKVFSSDLKRCTSSQGAQEPLKKERQGLLDIWIVALSGFFVLGLSSCLMFYCVTGMKLLKLKNEEHIGVVHD